MKYLIYQYFFTDMDTIYMTYTHHTFLQLRRLQDCTLLTIIDWIEFFLVNNLQMTVI